MTSNSHGAPPLRRPIFVVAPPRAGARLIACALAAAPGTWSLAGGLGPLLAAISDLDPPDGQKGGRLQAEDCRAEVRERLYAHLRAHAPAPNRSSESRLFDASPRNALMVPFLYSAFPDATFVYVHRRPYEALAESLLLWRTGTATTYPDLPGWIGPRWSFLLVPTWRELIGLPLAAIVTEQWVRTMRTMIADLEALPPQSWCVTDYDALRADGRSELTRLLEFLDLNRSAPATAAVATAPPFRLTGLELEAAAMELSPYLGRTEALAAQAADWIAPKRAEIEQT